VGTTSETISPAQLAQIIEEYLTDHPEAALLEDGRVLFDMRMARYAVKESHGRCLLEMWSEERNIVRTVTAAQERAQALRLTVRRMGAPRPQTLELVASSDRRTPTARDAQRRNYLRLLERVLTRNFPGAKVDGMRSAMDLEHSFGPAYVRGRLLKGTAADAVIGVGSAESSAMVDGILTLGLLWLDYCRQHGDGRRHFGGLKVIVPAGAWRTTAERLNWINHAAAEFELYELNERSEELAPVDFRDSGNVESRLVHAFNAGAAIERCRNGIDSLLNLLPEGAQKRIELRAHSTTEIGLLLYGLEFARVRLGASARSFGRDEEVSFGAGASETLLTEENQEICRELCARLFHSRHSGGTHSDPLFRMQPEGWLESEIEAQVGELIPGLRSDTVYRQVPAMACGNRGMMDLLTIDRAGRLAVLEVKAVEDLHLPLQALDYWIRVRALNADRKPAQGGTKTVGAFERSGYFPGAELSESDPRLLVAAPALRIHPANETVLRFFSPRVEWELMGLGEDWRRELRVIFRKRSRVSPSS